MRSHANEYWSDDISLLENTAVLAIDLQNANELDGGWPVHDYQGVLTRSQAILGAARRANVPVIYTRQWHARDGSDLLRFEDAGPDGQPLHCVEHTRDAEISTAVTPVLGDIIVDKTRYSAFYDTRLSAVLERLNVETLMVIGVWTEACVEATVNDAIFRGYRVALVKDACTTATVAMHRSAVLNMANWLYGGQVMTSDAAVAAFEGREYSAWRFTVPAQFKFDIDTIDSLYEQIQ